MNCAFDKEKLTGYYDGELDAAEKADVERHIAACSECLRELSELKSAALMVKELPRLRAPRSIAEGVAREISASGRVHSMARFRRNLLWIASAAAALFVVVNGVFFMNRSAETPVAIKSDPGTSTPVPPMGDMKLGSESKQRLEQQQSQDRAYRDDAARRQIEERKAVPHDEAKNLQEGAPREKAEQLKKGADDGVRGRTAAGGGAGPAKSAEPPAAAVNKAPAPAAPPAPLAEKPAPAPPATEKPAARPAEDGRDKKTLDAVTDKAVAKEKEAAEPARKESDFKAQRVVGDNAAKDATAEASPAHYTLAALQVAKARTQVEDALRKMGCSLPPAPAAPKFSKTAPREPDNTITLELTESQIARLKRDFDKPGDTKLVAGTPEDPLASYLRGGGFFGQKREAGAAAPAGKSADPKKADAPTAKGDAKDAEEVERAKAAEESKTAGSEPRRKIVLHLMEVKSLPADSEPPPVKK